MTPERPYMKSARVVGEERPDPGEGGGDHYRLLLEPEFTGTVRLVGGSEGGVGDGKSGP